MHSPARTDAAARIFRAGRALALLVCIQTSFMGCASGTAQNGFRFESHELTALHAQGVVGDTIVQHLALQVLARGDSQPLGYQFYIYPYFSSSNDERVKRIREAAKRALLKLFDDVDLYTGQSFRRDQAALFVLPLKSSDDRDALKAEPRLDASHAAELLENAYDYGWAGEQIRHAVEGQDSADGPLLPVSFVITRHPLQAGSTNSPIYVVPIAHPDLAAVTLDRVERALRVDHAQLPAYEDHLTRLLSWVGEVVLVNGDTLSAR